MQFYKANFPFSFRKYSCFFPCRCRCVHKIHTFCPKIHICNLWRLGRCIIEEINDWKTSVLFCKYLHNESLDLHEISCGSQLLSCKLKYQISWRSVHKCARTGCKRAHFAIKRARAPLQLVRMHLMHISLWKLKL